MSRARLLDLRFAADPCLLRGVRESVRSAVARLSDDARDAEDVVIAVNEACMNIIQHAYGEHPGEIELFLEAGEEGVEVVLRDHAAPVDFCCIQPRALDDLRPGGLGTHFMREVMDECVYAHLEEPRGNELRMRKRLRVNRGHEGRGEEGT